MSGDDAACVGQDMANLLAIMARLRTPGTGCAWDLAQDFATVAPYTIEEAYEVADAISRGDLDDLRDELGDLLLQVVFHARMAEERGAFAFPDVVEAITAKMIRRHPHVFGDAPDRSPEAIRGSWARIKAQEKAERHARRAADGAPDDTGLLAGVPGGLPPMTRALRLQQVAATVGFDWPDVAQVLDKVDEEIAEVKEALAEMSSDNGRAHDHTHARAALESEIGDALFSLVNLARHTGIDPEQALTSTNKKFYNRFNHVQKTIENSGQALNEASLDEMEMHWRDAKRLAGHS